MNLGSRLKSILADRGLTVTQFSKLADIPAQTLYALINRDSNKADVNILLKLLSALDMDFAAFMGVEPGTSKSGTGQTLPAGEQGQPLVKEVVKEVPVEVIKEVVREVPVEVIKEVVREVPAPAPDGKAVIYADAKLYEQIVELAAEEGITDSAAISQILNEYLEAGFGYRQRPLRSMFRDAKPHSGHSGDMDSFLL
jgi:transcriptional regulator with XRE-family HTH domain